MPKLDLNDVTELYGEAYQHDSADENRVEAWRGIATAIVRTFPEALDALDVGCGAGRLCLELANFGLDTWGIEGSHAAVGKLPARIMVWDLRVPLTCLQRFDLVTCFDVGEHVGNAEALADTVCSATHEWLLFGAATPDQGGLGHIDCRPYEDWHQLFAARGLEHKPDLTTKLKEAITREPGTNFMWWVEKNVHVYKRVKP